MLQMRDSSHKQDASMCIVKMRKVRESVAGDRNISAVVCLAREVSRTNLIRQFGFFRYADTSCECQVVRGMLRVFSPRLFHHRSVIKLRIMQIR